jgi:hypothetical protein
MPLSHSQAIHLENYAKRLTTYLSQARSRGYSRKRVAVLANISPGWLSDLANRKDGPSEETNAKIIAAFGTIGIDTSDLTRLLAEARTRATTSWDHGFRLITDNAELRNELFEIADEAEEIISCTGSRSREVRYLDSIIAALHKKQSVRHCRALYGPPWNQALKDHLLELIDLRNKTKHNRERIRISIVMNKEYLVSEQFVSANERRALVILPSFSEAGNFDTGMVFSQPEHVMRLIQYGEDLANLGRALKTRPSIQALPVREVPETSR